MVWQLYKYRLKRLANDKIELFWLAIFPIVLATFFNMAFSEISSNTESLDKIPVAVIREGDYPAAAALDTFLETMAGEGGVLEVLPVQDYEAAEEMLKAGEITGILRVSESLKLEFLESGMNQTILKYMVDSYLQGEAVLVEAAKRGEESFLAAVAAFAGQMEQNIELPISDGKLDPYAQYFFALMGMSCLFAASLGLLNTQEVQADQTRVAARRCISPIKKGWAVLTDVLAAFTIQLGIFLMLYGYLRFFLKIEFGDNFPMILLAGLASIFNGISYGYLLGVSIKARKTAKDAIMTSSVLALSFLAGLMMGNMKFIIEKNIPIINRINPAALIADCFYYLSVFGNMDRYFQCVITLLAEALLFGAASAFVLRKKKYRSI